MYVSPGAGPHQTLALLATETELSFPFFKVLNFGVVQLQQLEWDGSY